MINVFYSWQSDSSSSLNRNFINDALEKAKKSFKRGSEDIYIEMCVDTATNKLAGSPDIADSIFKKISNSQIFVCDVTIINPPSKFEKMMRFLTKKNVRLTPNPNVLIELGYASSVLGWDKVICVINTAQCKVEDLPFDIRNRRMLAYCYPNSSKLKKDIKDQLVKDLTSALVKSIESLEVVPKNINLNNVIILNKFCESVNSLGRFLNYFLADELGHEVATELINNSFYTVVEQDQQAFIDSIVSVFTRKNLDELSNSVSASEKRLSWKEYFIFALQKISDGFENLLMRYSGSADQTLIYELQELKNFTETVIDSFYSNNSQYMKETYPDEVRSKTYAESILKPYLLQLIRVRILVLSYSSSP